MPDETDTLGVCPDCGAELLPSQLLVEYEKDDGSQGVFADCYDCDKVVRPE